MARPLARRQPRDVGFITSEEAEMQGNIAARAGRWSAAHWKTATFGWLGLVVLAVALGSVALDPEVVAQLLSKRKPLDVLSRRELEVLALMAEGRSNAAIANRLVLTLGAVEKHVASILAKLRLPPSSEDHRRVLAVLAYLQEA
jgi:DNA-binding NarL/FixJ family response regulator